MKTWIPKRPPSKGATAYHNAVVNTSWHKENVKELINLIQEKIKPHDRIVDFGAGTGSSAMYLLKYLKPTSKLLLVDNSPSWLTKAYNLLHLNKRVQFFLLEKKGDDYMTLDELIGKTTASHIVSANTIHLIPNIEKVFRDIYSVLKNNGTFTFQSGNIIQPNKENGILTIDDSINAVHDIALEIIRTNRAFRKYKKGLDRRIEEQNHQRKFVFPAPRPVKFYLDALKSVGFKNESITRKRIKVKYKDWLNFLKVRRLQAGILPEVGGKDASEIEEKDRDTIITQASLMLFKRLKVKNPLSNARSFTAEWIYVYAEK